MSRVVTAAALLAAASIVSLGGCTSAIDPAPGTESATPVALGPELWGNAALWTSPEGEVSMCEGPYFVGEGRDPQICEHPLDVSGVDVSELHSASPGLGPLGQAGWTWTAHVFTGYLDGNHFTVTGVDSEAGLAAARVLLPTPTSRPGYATDEEKLAAMYAQADPVGYGCTAPEGGWRDAGDLEGKIGPYTAGYPDQVVGWAPLWVADDVHVALIGAAADADIEAVRADMQRVFPDSACVVASRISAADLRRAQADPAFGPDPSIGRSSSDAGGRAIADPYIWLTTNALTDDLTTARQSYPKGFVMISTWFNPLP